ncbi:MAG: hypothetical protein V8T46_07580 [Sutterella seckii]
MSRATFSAPAGTPQSRTEEGPAGVQEVRVGFLAYSPPWYDGAFVDESIRYLAWRLPEYRFSVHFLSAEALEKSVAAKNVDLVVAPAHSLPSALPIRFTSSRALFRTRRPTRAVRSAPPSSCGATGRI